MMFGAKDILYSFKNMHLADAPADLSHCQYLKYSAQKLGFESYENFRSYLKSPPKDRIENVYTELMRKICAFRLPKEEKNYIFMTSYGVTSIGYDSYWIGWDNRGREVRVPRDSYFNNRFDELREKISGSIYVIETKTELLAWKFMWHSSAVVPYNLAKKNFGSLFDKEHLVAKEPPLHLVKKNTQRELKSLGLI